MASILEQLKEIGTLAGVDVSGTTVQEALISFKKGLTAKGAPVSKEIQKRTEEEDTPTRARRTKTSDK